MVFTLIAGSVAALICGVESRSDETYQNHLMVFANAVENRKVWWLITATKVKNFVDGYVVIAT